MRLIKYLTEAYKASPKEIKAAAKSIAKRKSVKEKYLEFIGAEDYGDMGKLFYFNVTDKKHKDYKSTLAEKI